MEPCQHCVVFFLCRAGKRRKGRESAGLLQMCWRGPAIAGPDRKAEARALRSGRMRGHSTPLCWCESRARKQTKNWLQRATATGAMMVCPPKTPLFVLEVCSSVLLARQPTSPNNRANKGQPTSPARSRPSTSRETPKPVYCRMAGPCRRSLHPKQRKMRRASHGVARSG